MTLKEASGLGRSHAGAGRMKSVTADFESWEHWKAYLRGYFRGAGHAENGNRHQRKRSKGYLI